MRDTWYNPAAASGDPEAIQNRASVARLMTVKQTAKAQEMASETNVSFPGLRSALFSTHTSHIAIGPLHLESLSSADQ